MCVSKNVCVCLCVCVCNPGQFQDGAEPCRCHSFSASLRSQIRDASPTPVASD